MRETNVRLSTNVVRVVFQKPLDARYVLLRLQIRRSVFATKLVSKHRVRNIHWVVYITTSFDWSISFPRFREKA
jgi:hypothetical protein